MANKVELYFFFNVDDQQKRLTTSFSLNKKIRNFDAYLSKIVKIPRKYLLVKPSKKARPIGLMQDLTQTVSELVDEYGTSFNLYNLLEQPIELHITTKTTYQNRWNTQFNKAKREKSFREILPELVEWSGYPITDMKFIQAIDENPRELLKEDYDLKIPALVQKYGSSFQLISLSWNGW